MATLDLRNKIPVIPDKYKVKDDIVLQRVILYEFKLYLEDYSPAIIREAFSEWKTTDIGAWCVIHANELAYTQKHDPMYNAYDVIIYGYMEPKNYTWFLLNKT